MVVLQMLVALLHLSLLSSALSCFRDPKRQFVPPAQVPTPCVVKDDLGNNIDRTRSDKEEWTDSTKMCMCRKTIKDFKTKWQHQCIRIGCRHAAVYWGTHYCRVQNNRKCVCHLKTDKSQLDMNKRYIFSWKCEKRPSNCVPKLNP